jgi:ribosomal 50S subunit-recycling heat shock protein
MKIREDVEAMLPSRKIVPGDYITTKYDRHMTVYKVKAITNTKILGATNNYVSCARVWDGQSYLFAESEIVLLHK